MKRIPSVKTLSRVFGDKAKTARRILEMSHAELSANPAAAARIRERWHAPAGHDGRLTALDALGGTFRVEYAFAHRREPAR